MTTIHVRRVLALGRMAVGASAWLAPRPAARAFGIDPERSDPMTTRLFGIRDLVMGTAVLVAPADRLAEAATVGAVVDAIDTVSVAIEFRRGSVSPWAGIFGGVGAAFLAVLGVVVARDASRAT